MAHHPGYRRVRLVTFRTDAAPRLGAVSGDAIVDLSVALPGGAETTMFDLITSGDRGITAVREMVEAHEPSVPLSDAQLLAPLAAQRNVFAVGRNYVEHVKEGASVRSETAELPTVPVFFTKATASVTGPGDVPYPSATEQLDWEGELAVVLGRGGRDIPASSALEHVFGYTVANDLSARDLQFRHTQWFKGKSLDGSCPIGPWLVTADEIPDPQSLPIRCRVNGALKQDSHTSRMIFDIATIIESLSTGMTLQAGDVILTGTPEGVGFARKPPEYLCPGDIVEVTIDGIGTLLTRLVHGRSHDA